MTRIRDCMMKLIASEVCETPLDLASLGTLTREEHKELYLLSKSHDLSHIVASALSKASLLVSEYDTSALFEKQMMTALYRYEQTRFAYDELCSTLEISGIDHIPLKGSIIRDYYPEPWMRTSCDIDVLVRKADIERASDILTERLAYTDKDLGPHDVSFFTAGGVHVELHYDLLEDDRANACRDVLCEIWSYAQKKDGYAHRYELDDDMFYFYHIAHIAKHLEVGGCGVRPFLDLWILTHKVEYDREQRRALLMKGRLLGFAEISERLCEIWFGEGQHDELSARLEDFILCGGVYGTRENKVAVMRTKRGSKFRYLMSRIFLSYDVIKYQYPILFKHKWLLPVANIRRWFRLIFCGKAKLSVYELKKNNEISEDQANEVADLFRQIGL